MREMLDWWTVRGERWGVKNLDFKIEIQRDSAVRPHRLADYTEADLNAFDGGDWQFGRLRLVPVSRDLVDMIGAEQTLTHVEWGEMPGGRIDREQVTEEQGMDLARWAVATLRRAGVPVETEQDSELSVRLLTAPF